MVSFLISILALVVGYLLYGRFVERIFAPDPKRQTPAYAKADGVDYIAMPTWKVFMIQFLNIAGTGPIFGAIMGAKFGPASYLWIVFGCIFAGAVHDYLSGMLSVRGGGIGYPEIIGKYLGNTTRKVVLVFTILLLLMVGAVFAYSPAIILGDLAGDGSPASVLIWVGVVFAYYVNPARVVLRSYDADDLLTFDGLRVATTFWEALGIDEPTEIENQKSTLKNHKLILRNGHIIVTDGDSEYSLLGQKK